MIKKVRFDLSPASSQRSPTPKEKIPQKQAPVCQVTAKVAHTSTRMLNESKIQKKAQASQPIRATPQKVDEELKKAGFDAALQRKHPDAVIFLQTSGIGSFLKKTHLHFGKNDQNELTVPVEGKLLAWSELKKKLELDPSWDGKSIPTSWRFDASGLRPVSASQWEVLIPTSKEAPHPGKWYLDFMTTTQGMNHSWVRLVDEKGNVLSIGMAGEIYSMFMFRGSVAKINCPDHREFSPEAHRKTRIAISEEEYSRALSKIVQDQKDHNFYFNLLSRNCSVYASEVAKEVGVTIDNLEFISQTLNRSLLNRIKIKLPKPLLKVVAATQYIVRAILGTLAMVFMGAWYQNKEVKTLEGNYKARWKTLPHKPFRSLKSFFDGTNYKMRSTFMVAEWQKFVIRHRKERLKVLDESKGLLLQELSPLNLERFEKKWRHFREEIEYEKPPKLGGESLFIDNSQPIDKTDLTQRILKFKNAFIESESTE